MERLIVKESRKKMLLLLAVFVAGLFFLLWFATELRGVNFGFLHIVAGLGLLLYVALAVVVAYRALNPGERIVIDDTGIRLRGVGTIPWQDIEGAFVRRAGVQDLLCLRVRNEEDYLKHVQGLGRLAVDANRKAGLTPFVLTVSGTDCAFDRLVEIVSQRTTVERAI